MAVSLAGSCELNLSKSIGRVFRRVLGAVPAVHNGRAEVVPERHGGVGVSRSSALTQRSITDTKRRDEGPISTPQHITVTLQLPGRVLHKGGANSFLVDLGDPSL